MSYFERLIDLRRTTAGKVVAVLMSVLMVLSMSNIALALNYAWADEGEDVAIEEDNATIKDASASADPDDSEEAEKGVVATVAKAVEEKVEEINNLSDAKANETNDQASRETIEITVASESDDSDGSSEPSEEPKAILESVVDGITAKWDVETSTITISGHSMFNTSTLTGFGFKDVDGNEITWKPIVKHVVIQGDEEGNIILDPADGAALHQPFRDNNIIGSQSGGYTLTMNNVNGIPTNYFISANYMNSCFLKNVGDINLSAFFNCKNLTSVNIDGCGKIGAYVFTGCSSLQSCSFNNVKSFTASGNIFNAYGAAPACTALQTITVSNVASIPANFATGCTGLKTLNLTNVNTIEAQALYNIASLEKVVVSGKLDTVGSKAFYYCTNLESVEWSGATTIQSQAFFNCKKLKSIDLSEVSKISTYAFAYCNALESIGDITNVDYVGGFAFYGCNNEKLLAYFEALINDPNFNSVKLGFNTQYDLSDPDTVQMLRERIKDILFGKFKLDGADAVVELTPEDGYEDSTIARDEDLLWAKYDNRAQVIQQARWANEDKTEAEIRVDAYFTAEKQMDYIFVADLSASMAFMGNEGDSNARFYDMQSKLNDMVSNLMGSAGYDCKVTIITFGGYLNAKTPGSVTTSDEFTDMDEALDYINTGLAPLYENTDYKLGLSEALQAVQNKDDRKTSVIFLSDGCPTYDGSTYLVDNQRETYNAEVKEIADEIRASGAEVYGVLHSPSSAEAEKAQAAMFAVCGTTGDDDEAIDNYWTSRDTESFSDAMNLAFTATYPSYELVIPVGDDFENVQNIKLSESAGSARYDEESNSVVWILEGMPFTRHTLTFQTSLKQSALDRDVEAGEYDYLNNGAGPDLNGATIKKLPGGEIVHQIFSTTLKRSVVPQYAPETPTTPTNPTNPITPTAPVTPTNPVVNPGAGAGAPAGATTPATPATPAGGPAAPGGGAGAGAGAGDGAAAPAAIPDDATPLANPDDAADQIDDDANPLANFDQIVPECWVHWLLLAGLVASIIYGAGVVVSRKNEINAIENAEQRAMGNTATRQYVASVLRQHS